MLFDRRELLAVSALTLAFTAAGCRQAEQAAPPGEAPAGSDPKALLDGMAERLLAEYPENAAVLGLDKDKNAALKARLTDRSPDGNARRAAAAAERLGQLKAIDRAGLDPATALDLDVAQAAHELAVEGYRRFPFGDVALLNQNWNYRSTPYAVSQNSGAYVELPDLIDSQHGVAAAADIESYLQRMDGFAAALDGETERLRADSGRGVIAPSFVIDTANTQMKAMLATPPAQWTLASGLVTKAGNAGLDGAGAGAKAEAMIRNRIAPALQRQQALMEELRAKADDRAGVWKQPDGEAYYAWALRAATTTNLSADEIHRIGLEQVKAIGAEMDAGLKALGLSKGSVGERMEALGKDPRYTFPNDDIGRAQILAYVNDRVADMRTRLPRAFKTLVKGNLIIKRVPPAIEAGAPGGYAGPGSMDGSVPGNYYINLRDTGLWPKFSLPTLTYHEGIPGHIWQGEYSYKLPLIRSLLAFNAYSEGWALYAETIADELGAYAEDPAGRLGYLQSMGFRACRLVVDTGLHAKRWTRDQAIQWFVETNGSTQEEVRGEVDRYCSWPGQACGYKVGQIEMLRLREKAKGALGARFDVRGFNDALVLGGSVPLTLLERVIDRYIAAS